MSQVSMKARRRLASSTPAFEQVLVRDPPYHARRHADDHLARAHVARHDGTRRDERLLADDHAGTEHGPAAHSAGPAKHGPADRVGGYVAAHRVVVCRDHPGADKHVVLDDRTAGDVDPGLDQDPLPHARIEVDGRTAAHDRARADYRTLTH